MEMQQRSELVHAKNLLAKRWRLPGEFAGFHGRLSVSAARIKPAPGREIAAPSRSETGVGASNKFAATRSAPRTPPPAHDSRPFRAQLVERDVAAENQASRYRGRHLPEAE